jgi:SH3-like domain-containing protein
MRRGIVAVFVAAAALFSLNSATADQPARFMSLRSAGAEARQGPGAEHGVAWIYEHARLPLEVIGQRDRWVHVRDPDGAESWMLADNLEARRTVFVREQVTLRRQARLSGQPVAYLMPGVIGAVTACNGEWRRVAVGGRIGWVQNNALWGGECAGLDTATRP